jgi:hypothetical protein
MTSALTKTWTRLARRLGYDRSPLHRRSDVVEAWLVPAAIAAFLALCPVIAGVASISVHADNAAARHAERSWHRVTAVLVRSAPGPEMSDGGANAWVVWTPARWTVHGHHVTGDVPAPARSSAGSTLTVWLNRAGKVQLPTLTAAQAEGRIVSDTLISMAALAVLLAILVWQARRALDRRRLASWEIAWLAVEPRWTHQG